MNIPEGHRERLRQRFLTHPEALTEAERLELLLTYAIPRRDVLPLAEELLSHFGSLDAIISASEQELMHIDGIGESTITFLHLLDYLVKEARNSVTGTSKSQAPNAQLNLFELGSEQIKESARGVKTRTMRVFANDEVANSLAFLPQAAGFNNLEDFKKFLCGKLPYNAAETRTRRTRNILERFYPSGQLDTPLTYFAARCSSAADLQPVVFYHVLKAELIAAKVAEELIWPALPIGRVERDQITEFISHNMPEVKQASLEKMLESLAHTYSLTGLGSIDKKSFRFQLRRGSLEGFLYILTSVFPEPGMYSFEALYNSPVHRWLLWDREWIRQQLYNLQDFGVLTKVSEIDTVRQFSLSVDQRAALHLFFEHPERKQKSIREQAEHQNTGQEGQP